MANLVTTTVKNVSIENIKFSANVIVLAKQSTSVSANGVVTNTVKYIEIGSLKDTKELSIIKELLKYCLAEYKATKELQSEIKDTNISVRKNVISPFLSTNVIFRTDSDGKISKAIISDVALNKTALNIKDTHTLSYCIPANLKAAIHNHANVVLKQCTIISDIIKHANLITSLLSDNAKITRKTKSNTTKQAETKQAV